MRSTDYDITPNYESIGRQFVELVEAIVEHSLRNHFHVSDNPSMSFDDPQPQDDPNCPDSRFNTPII